MAETTIVETLEYKTQIHTAWDNTEQRAAIRTYPRRAISYDYYGMTPAQSQYLRALSYAKQNEQIEIPLWHAACKLTEDAAVSLTHVMVDPSDVWPFRGCSGLMFWHNDQEGGERYFLGALNATGNLKLTEQLELAYPRQTTLVCPVSYGYLKSTTDYSILTSAYLSMQLNAELLDDFSSTSIPAGLNEDTFEVWGRKTPYQEALPSSYKGVDIFPLAPSWVDDLSASITRNANTLDNESGIVKFDLKSEYASENRDIEYVLSSKTEINNFQRFFCRCKGRLKSFYMPTWLNDLVLAEDAPIGQTYLHVKWPLYWQYYAKTTRRKVAIFFLKSGSVKILPIGGYATSTDGTMGKVFLDSALTEAMKASDVVLASYLCRYRFDSDKLTTEYDTTGLASAAVSFAEVNA